MNLSLTLFIIGVLGFVLYIKDFPFLVTSNKTVLLARIFFFLLINLFNFFNINKNYYIYLYKQLKYLIFKKVDHYYFYYYKVLIFNYYYFLIIIIVIVIFYYYYFFYYNCYYGRNRYRYYYYFFDNF